MANSDEGGSSTTVDTTGETNFEQNPTPSQTQTLTKTAQKKLLKQERLAARKAEKKAAEKRRKAERKEQRRHEWDERLESLSLEEKAKLIESRKEAKRERIEKERGEHRIKIERLRRAAEVGQKIIIDLDFGHLMTATEIQSLSQQIMYCYASNSRSTVPVHLYLTGCTGEMETRLHKIPGFNNWIIEKDARPYIQVLKDQEEDLVYLTADSENVLDELDSKSIYVIGGLVDRNRFKGLTMKRAKDQGIKSAKLPIGNYLKMSSSQVLTVNQVFEIMLNFIETRDWKTAFYKVIPQRKRDNVEAERDDVSGRHARDITEQVREEEEEVEGCARKKHCVRESQNSETVEFDDNSTGDNVVN